VTLGFAFDLTVCAMLLFLAWRSISVQSLFAGVVLYVVFGVVLALAWLRLGAVDVALAEAAIGAGMTGVLLLGALGEIARASAERRRREGPP
jgi:uncharacterized MnhB-related membrane protein